MTAAQLIPFLVAILLLYATPGPSMILLTQTTLRHGLRCAFISAAALNAGEAILVFAAAGGLALALSVAKPLAVAVAWFGLAYLLWRAGRAWHDVMMPPALSAVVRRRRKFHLALPGFAVAFSNPATLIFFTALLPQFVVPGADEGRQLLKLAVIYAAAVIALDIAFVLAVSRFAKPHAIRLGPRAGFLCNAVALTAIATFVTTHAIGGLPSLTEWIPQSIAATR
jgi:homoserine/homoserine lactone efflux protein